MSRRDFHFATAAMRDARMLKVFARVVAVACFALAVLGYVSQLSPTGPVSLAGRAVGAAVAGTAVMVGARWLRRPWPGYGLAVAFVVWADLAVAILAISMSTPEARLCTTVYLGVVAVFVGFLLGGSILLAHCAFSGAVVAGVVGWAVLVEGHTVLSLFAVLGPALAWTMALPLGGLALIDIGRNSLRRTVRTAQHNPLTGLRNRRGMNAAVSERIRTMSPAGVAIAVCDIDRFKAFNDGHGHPAGDAALLRLARTLQSLARDTEVTARIGGDEFVLVSFANRQNDISMLLSRLDALTQGEMDGVALTASIGVAWHPCDEPHFSIDDAIRHADSAMYDAKRAGGAQCAIYGPAFEQG